MNMIRKWKGKEQAKSSNFLSQWHNYNRMQVQVKSVNCRLTNDRNKGNTNSHLGERKTTFLGVCSSPCHYPNWKTWNRSVINFTHSWTIVNFSSLIILESCLKKHSPPHEDKLSWANKCLKRYLQFTHSQRFVRSKILRARVAENQLIICISKPWTKSIKYFNVECFRRTLPKFESK